MTMTMTGMVSWLMMCVVLAVVVVSPMTTSVGTFLVSAQTGTDAEEELITATSLQLPLIEGNVTALPPLPGFDWDVLLGSTPASSFLNGTPFDVNALLGGNASALDAFRQGVATTLPNTTQLDWFALLSGNTSSLDAFRFDLNALLGNASALDALLQSVEAALPNNSLLYWFEVLSGVSGNVSSLDTFRQLVPLFNAVRGIPGLNWTAILGANTTSILSVWNDVP
ncbi:hypothetical protein RI054_40g146280 [Pseudoscourfieldia marina]